MGNLNIIAGASFPSTIPKIPIVDGLESSGSLLLVEPGHSSNPWNGLPSTGSTVPNLLRSTANTVTQKATTDAPLIWNYTNGQGLVERTPKGGVHVIAKTTSTSVVDIRFMVEFPADIANYIAANYTHRYFASVWVQTTATKDPALTTDVSVMKMQTDSIFGIELNNIIGARYASNIRTPFNFTDAKGNYRLNAEFTSLRDMGGKTAPFAKQSAFQAGNRMNISNANAGKVGSYIFYRTYVEDLTVSGRTYAECEALDASLHAQAFGPGGRYYGDTFTAP